MTDRYDLILVGEGASFALAEAAVRGFLRNLASTQLAVPVDEAVAQRWAEVYLAPGPLAHSLFVKGAAPPEPAFLEAALRFGDAPEALPFGNVSAHFWLELRGAMLPEVVPGFARRFELELGTRPRVLSRPHAGLPPHRVVPEGERRAGPPARVTHGPGKVGTTVEEF
jgi:hypothetical protein